MATLADRLDALQEVLELADDRLPVDTVNRATVLLDHADARLGAGEQTVVALAGATGSGKSSLVNALSGSMVAIQGVRRPTTSVALAVSFAATNGELLDLLEIPRRHEVAPPGPEMDSLVLLDLPDHDSTQRAHQKEVDRLIRMVDRFIFVLDPQKYADAAIHRGYLQPLAPYRDVITVVLNHADKLSAADLASCLADLTRLLGQDGLAGVPVFATSALTGQGVPELRAHLTEAAVGKKAVVARLETDLDVIARELDEALGHGSTSLPGVDPLIRHLEISAGVPAVVEAVEATVRHRGTLATGWPLVQWIARLRADPLDRLMLSAPRAAVGKRSAEGMTLRVFSQEATAGMPSDWREAVDAAVRDTEDELPEALDAAVAAADLGADARPGWWSVMRVLQWLLIVVIVAGIVWLLVAPGWEAVACIVGGIVAGILLSLLARAINVAAARRAKARATLVLREAITEVAEREVLTPVRAELKHYVAAQVALQRVAR